MKTKNPFLGWPLLMVVLSCSFLSQSCKSFKEISAPWVGGIYHRPYTDSQVLVWKDPGATSTAFNALISGYMSADPGMRRFECGSCDSSMVILQSAAMANGGGLVGQLASNNPTGDIRPSGGGPTVAYWSMNYYVIANDPVNQRIDGLKQPKVSNPPSNPNTNLTPIVVGVFDSGQDPAYVNAAQANYTNANAGCLGTGSNNGWNVPDHTSDVRDMYASPHGHGKHVAALSIQKSAQADLNPIKILPVKFISTRASTLYDVLCGIAYASERGADILNASFGYYASRTPGIGAPINLLFKNYLRYYTLDKPGAKKMIVVAAAGNEDNSQQLTNCGMVSRDLNQVYFFPASFAESADLPNIIVVTTVGDDPALKVSPRQNYSSTIVNIGVAADEILNNREFLFRTPYYSSTKYIQGSSYATPLFTGLLSAHLAEIKRNHPNDYFKKSVIMSFLAEHSTIQHDVVLEPFINGGYYIRH